MIVYLIITVTFCAKLLLKYSYGRMFKCVFDKRS
jgi:hypothetical protein